MKHPLGDTYVGESAGSDGWTALLGEREKRHKYGRSGTGVCEFVPLSHETYGRVGPAAMKFLDRIARTAAGAGNISKRAFLENAMRRLSTTLCRGIAVQARASAPLRARHLRRAVLPGLLQPTDELLPQTGEV